MSFYRYLFAAIAAIVITSPVAANETMKTTPTAAPTAPGHASMQTASAEQNVSEALIKINVNKATAKELLKVKGMNASRARAIVTYRKKHGEFKTIDDLGKVRALSKLKPEDLKVILDQLSLS